MTEFLMRVKYNKREMTNYYACPQNLEIATALIFSFLTKIMHVNLIFRNPIRIIVSLGWCTEKSCRF